MFRFAEHHIFPSKAVNVPGKRRMKSVIETAIGAKDGIKEITAVTFRSDAAAILESLLAELSEEEVLRAIERQGFSAAAYRPTLRALAEISRSRRVERRMEN